jgi:chemotaxis-related protein WspB
MLLLLFETSDGRYALDSQQIVEVIPLLVPKKIPGAPDYVAGIINYRGKPVPVFDLCILAGGPPCHHYYSTRIVLIHYPLDGVRERLIGLIAERATDVFKCREEDIKSSGILLEKDSAGQTVEAGREEIIQLYDVVRMIPADIVRDLF